MKDNSGLFHPTIDQRQNSGLLKRYCSSFQQLVSSSKQVMLIQGIHHVAVICSDYDRARHFYTQVLGLQVLRETYREARSSYKLDLQLPDGHQLELFSFPEPPPRPSYPEACGLRHLAFSVPDLDAAVTHLKSHQVRVEAIRVDQLTGRRFTFFHDPDDLPLELYEAQGVISNGAAQ